jgi:hypothetical protein
MQVFVVENDDGEAIAAIGVPDDEAPAFEGCRNFLVPNAEQAKEFEASCSRPDHSRMSADPHRWITTLKKK